MNQYLLSSKDVSKEYLEYFINSRGLNNSQMAKALEVERATVGAWISGKREISEKYREKIFEFSKLLPTDDLIITPAVSKLIKCIKNADDEGDLDFIINAFVRTTNEVAYKFIDFSPHSVKKTEIDALENLLISFDDISLTEINNLISRVLNYRMYIYALSPDEYVEKCKNAVELSRMERERLRLLPQFVHIADEAFNDDLIIELHDDILYVHFSLSFNINKELDKRSDEINEDFKEWNEEFNCYDDVFDNITGECLLYDDDLEKALKPIKEEHIESVYERVEHLFRHTDFFPESDNDQWIENNTYSVTYRIELINPKFKESLRIVMERAGIKVELLNN
ncbi:TPA: hypothetical protein F7146_10215 [Legionella pneumophila]|nr:hypothetical protein [Legionella pneumophila]